MDRKKISIIIPTRDRKDSLKVALNSIAASDYPRDDFEVIVVDDGSIDGTDELVLELQGRASIILRYYKQERKGLSAAKNIGIKHARGDFLVFTDDDCIIEKDWLRKLTHAFDSPMVGVVGGPDRTPPASSPLARSIDYSVTSFIGTGGVREGRAIRLAKYFPRGCNTAVTKSALEEIGDFDESFGAGEDIELVYRVKRAGYMIRYAPEAFVWHKRRDSIRSFLKQIFSRGYWRVKLAHRHRELLEVSYLLPAGMIVVFIILLGISFVFPHVLKGLVFLVSLYFLILIVGGFEGAIRIGDPRALFLIPFLVLLQHLAYGSGFLIGLTHWKSHV